MSLLLIQQQKYRLFLVLNVMLEVQDQVLSVEDYTCTHGPKRTKLCQTSRIQTIYGIFMPLCISLANQELKALRGDCTQHAMVAVRLFSG